MRLLFELDKKDYDPNGVAFVRHSARSIIIKNGRIAMVRSVKFNYYKFPGGGIEPGESREAAMMRETLEEAGLTVIPESVKEYGYVHRAQKSNHPTEEYFVQDNFYYFCQVEDTLKVQELGEYEREEGFELEWVEPEKAIFANRKIDHGRKDRNMIEREAAMLELLMAEGYFN